MMSESAERNHGYGAPRPFGTLTGVKDGDLPVSIADAVYKRDVAEGRIVEVPKYNGPPLIVVYPRPIPLDVIEKLKSDLYEAMNSGTCKIAVLEEGAKVFQLIDGRWQALT